MSKGQQNEVQLQNISKIDKKTEDIKARARDIYLENYALQDEIQRLKMRSDDLTQSLMRFKSSRENGQQTSQRKKQSSRGSSQEQRSSKSSGSSNRSRSSGSGASSSNSDSSSNSSAKNSDSQRNSSKSDQSGGKTTQSVMSQNSSRDSEQDQRKKKGKQRKEVKGADDEFRSEQMPESKGISSLSVELQERYIQSRVQQKLASLLPILCFNNSEKRSYPDRPYCNVVTIKLPKKEIMKMPNRSKVEYEEQKFVINCDTTFVQLRRDACGFWGIQPNNYSLFGAKFEHIMALNEDPQHAVHKVSSYFELLRVRTPILYLLKPLVEQMTLNSQQKESAMIKKSFSGSSGAPKIHHIENTSELKKRQILMQEKNLKTFITKFPDQYRYYIGDAGCQVRSARRDPDAFFSTFVFNVILISVTILSIFMTHTYSYEYWSNRAMHSIFDNQASQYPFSKVTNFANYEGFMKETVSQKVFSEEGSTDFRNLGIPTGNMSIIIQHLEQEECEYMKVTGSKETLGCRSYQREFKDDIVTPRGDHYHWQEGKATIVTQLQRKNPLGMGTQIQTDITGYKASFPFNMSETDYRTLMDDLFASKFIDRYSIKLCMIYTLQYVPSQDFFISTLIQFDFNLVGRTVPQTIQVFYLKNEQPTSTSGRTIMILSVARALACVYTMWLIIIKYRYRAVLENYNISIGRDACQLLLSLIPLLIQLTTPVKVSVDQMLQTPNPEFDFHWQAWIQLVKTYVDGLCVQFLSAKLIQSFRINKYIDWVFAAVNASLSAMLFFYILMAPFYMGVAFANYFLMGDRIKEVSTLQQSLYQIYRFVSGSLDSVHSYMIEPHLFVFVNWYLLMLYFYLFLPVSIAVLLDAFSMTVQGMGHVSDLAQRPGWTLKEMLEWMVDRNPTQFLEEELNVLKKKNRLRDELGDDLDGN